MRRTPAEKAYWMEDAMPYCENCAGRRNLEGHHVIYAQEVRREQGEQWDRRNRMTLCSRCHDLHHSRKQPIELWRLPDTAFEFARELLGPGHAYEYLARRYAGADPRLSHLAAEADSSADPHARIGEQAEKLEGGHEDA